MIGDWEIVGWPVVRIRDIGRLHGGGTPSRRRPEYFQGTIPWITGQDIPESHVAEIATARDYVTEEAVQESATRVAPAGAVLVTTRVSVGKTAVAGCPICFSQDVTAIIVHPGVIALPTYVAYFLRSRRDALLQKNQGSTIAGITRDSLALEQIPLPPLSEQQQIVEILQEAEAIRRLRAQVETKTAELIPALFAAIFGELYFGTSPFPVSLLSAIGELDRGRSRHRPRDEPSLYGGPYPFLQTGDIAQSNGWVSTYSQTYSEKGLEQSKLWSKGTLAITIAANIGSTAILTFDACFPDSIVGFTPNEGISAEYVRWWLLGYQKKLEIQAPQGAQKNINLEVLRSIRIPVPPAELQKRFDESLQDLREQITLNGSGDQQFTRLIASLSTHAFSGQLTANWREANEKKLAAEASDRDEALRQSTDRRIVLVANAGANTKAFASDIFQERTDGVYSDLNREQRTVFKAIKRMVGGVDYIRYFNATMLGDYIDKPPLRKNPQAIEGHIAVLVARGLLIPVSREEQTEDTGEYLFGNAYRLPLKDGRGVYTDSSGEPYLGSDGEPFTGEETPGDHTRLREMERLVGQLEKERMLK